MAYERQPARLTNAEFFQDFPLAVYQTTLDGKVDLHWHEFYELHLITSGFGDHWLNGRHYGLQRGSVFLLTPSDLHGLSSWPGCSLGLWDVVFSRDFIPNNLFQLIFGAPIDWCCDIPEASLASINSDLQRLYNERASRGIGHEFVIRATLERILVVPRLCMHVAVNSVGPTTPTWNPAIQTALTYMQHHFRHKLTLTQVASHVQYSPNYFSSSFTKQVGVPFQTVLQDLRLQFAKSLISGSGLSVTEVCFASGFQSVSHFNRSFRAKFGESPRKVRSYARR